MNYWTVSYNRTIDFHLVESRRDNTSMTLKRRSKVLRPCLDAVEGAAVYDRKRRFFQTRQKSWSVRRSTGDEDRHPTSKNKDQLTASNELKEKIR